jgi:hypothetical protein
MGQHSVKVIRCLREALSWVYHRTKGDMIKVRFAISLKLRPLAQDEDALSWTTMDKLRAQKSPQGLRRAGS